MTRLEKTIFVGSEEDCFANRKGWTVVHACKHPCFERALRYEAEHPRPQAGRLALSLNSDLYLNIVDGPAGSFRLEVFLDFLDFATKRFEEGKNLLIHCNQGRSRAPSLALLFLARYSLSRYAETYRKAERRFLSFYPAFRPGTGIRSYLIQNWDLLRTEDLQRYDRLDGNTL